MNDTSALLALFCSAAALAAAPVRADWVYDPAANTLSDGVSTVVSVTASGSDLTIGSNQKNANVSVLDFSRPIEGGYRIVKFSDSAFRSCANLTSVTLPDTLAGSLQWTFRDDEALTGDIVVPDGVTTMKETFYGTAITSLTLGTGLRTVLGGDGLCRGCKALTNVVFRSDCSLGANEFLDCSALRTATFRPGMSGAWIQTFKNCTSLEGDIELPRGVTGMKETFMNTKITSFRTLGTSLEYIGYATDGDGDFAGCGSLTNVVLNHGLLTIGRNVFRNCSRLGELVLPDTVKTFTSTLSGCNSLTNIVMSKDLETIGNRIFTGSQKRDIWWPSYPAAGFTSGGTDARDPMWDMYVENACVNWIKLGDKGWADFAAAYPDYCVLPDATKLHSAGWWKGGYSGSRKQILRWWLPHETVLLVR